MKWVFDDGGRAAAGFKGKTRDCVVRAIAIAAQLPYKQVCDSLDASCTYATRDGRSSSIKIGVFKQDSHRFLKALGWQWVPTMKIGQGCRVHLRPDELPGGRIVVKVSRHMVAVIDGVIHDTHDCSRKGKRCVYGYFIKSV